MKRASRKQAGFTLIELMIVAAIIGILAAIAYPSYERSLVKGNRANAQAFLMDVAQRQQQFLLDNRAYAASLADLNLAAPPDVTRHYTIDVDPDNAASPPAFVITAAPVAGGRQVEDGDLTIDQAGTKTPADKW